MTETTPDIVPAVAQNAIRHQLAGRPAHAQGALAELDIPQLRRLAQACVALTSAAAQLVVNQAIEKKKAGK